MTKSVRIATSTRAKAEARPADSATRPVEVSMDQLAGFASQFSEYTETGMKAMADSAAASSEMFREIGTRNMNFMTQTFEQGVELSQTLTTVRDPRELMELQAQFARSILAAYASEVSAQTELYAGAWREAAKPFLSRMAK